MFREQADLAERFERVVLVKVVRLVIGTALMRAARLFSKIASYAIVIFMLYWICLC